MSPPSGSRALVTERRLGVLLSHLRPCALPVARRGLDDLRVREAEAETGVAASPCAGDEKGEPSGGEHCVFCEIVKGNKPAYKLYEDDVCLCILDIKPLSTGKGDNLWSSETYKRNPIKHNQETKDLVSGIKELLFSPEDDRNEGSTIPKEL